MDAQPLLPGVRVRGGRTSGVLHSYLHLLSLHEDRTLTEVAGLIHPSHGLLLPNMVHVRGALVAAALWGYSSRVPTILAVSGVLQQPKQKQMNICGCYSSTVKVQRGISFLKDMSRTVRVSLRVFCGLL